MSKRRGARWLALFRPRPKTRRRIKPEFQRRDARCSASHRSLLSQLVAEDWRSTDRKLLEVRSCWLPLASASYWYWYWIVLIMVRLVVPIVWNHFCSLSSVMLGESIANAAASFHKVIRRRQTKPLQRFPFRADFRHCGYVGRASEPQTLSTKRAATVAST